MYVHVKAVSGSEAVAADLGGEGHCPECGGPIVHLSGCELCAVCGYSRCGG
ncbi:MAG: hypothetical protein QXU73_08390 [Thermoplasmata archaeon]